MHDRFFYQGFLQVGNPIVLSSEEEKHLRVMRIREGEIIEIINGKGILAKGVIQGKGIEILSLHEAPPSPLQVIIAQAIPKANRLDLIVEKGTELGMQELWLFPGDLSEKKELSQTLLHRLETIAIAATKQCGRLFIPKIVIKAPLNEWENLVLPAYFGDTAGSAPPFIQSWHKEKAMLFFVGPEKGFSKKEETHLRHLGAQGVKIHPYILRTDTAAIAFLSIIYHTTLT